MLRFALAAAALATAMPATAQVAVGGYIRNDGTYVAPHYRSRPDSSIYNNYSTSPNVNPYTGRVGTVNPYSSYTPRSYGYTPRYQPVQPSFGFKPRKGGF